MGIGPATGFGGVIAMIEELSAAIAAVLLAFSAPIDELRAGIIEGEFKVKNSQND